MREEGRVGLPAYPGMTTAILSPEWIIHIYETERMDTRMIRKMLPPKAAQLYVTLCSHRKADFTITASL